MCCSVLCCSVLQCVCLSSPCLASGLPGALLKIPVCCSILQCAMLQCVAGCCSVFVYPPCALRLFSFPRRIQNTGVLQCIVVCYVAVCCSVLQCFCVYSPCPAYGLPRPSFKMLVCALQTLSEDLIHKCDVTHSYV